MSRSKNFYQGISLGKVRRSEYEDSNLRDNGRQEARLLEDLKTVDRARNVMKKSMEADKHMLIKTGLPMSRKTPVTSHGTHPHPESKPPPHPAKTAADVRVKRFSVTEMPSDLDRTRHYRKKSTARPPSYHEQINNSSTNKEFSGSHDKLPESRTSGSQGEGKNCSTHQADAAAALGVSERLRRSEPTMSVELEQHGVVNLNRSTMSTAQASRSEKVLPVNNASIFESPLHLQGDTSGSSVRGPHRGKTDQHSIENGEDSKDRNCEQSEVKDQELKARKKATIWETLSTPKYTSLTKSKRSQIEQEFTASRMKSYRSSPALISNAKVKPQVLPGQGKPPLKENPSSQGRKIDEAKVKNVTATRSRID